MAIHFFDYSIPVKNAIDEQVAKFLEEAGGLVESKAKDNTRVDSGATRKLWSHVVQGNKCTIGNPFENAIWEEFGTGEHSAKGRKGGWWIPAWKLDNRTRYVLENKYHFKKRYGKRGRAYYYTEGKKGTQAFEKAFDSSKPLIEKRAKEIFGELNKK